MKKNIYLVIFEWKIEHTQKGFYRTGVSKYKVYGRNQLDAFNEIIRLAESMPSWDFEENKINIKDFMSNCVCLYKTQLTKVLSIEKSK